jgi:hypothetical protein
MINYLTTATQQQHNTAYTPNNKKLQLNQISHLISNGVIIPKSKLINLWYLILIDYLLLLFSHFTAYRHFKHMLINEHLMIWSKSKLVIISIESHLIKYILFTNSQMSKCRRYFVIFHEKNHIYWSIVVLLFIFSFVKLFLISKLWKKFW